MLVVLPIALPEVDRAVDLLEWCKELGSLKSHRVLIVFAHPVYEQERQRIIGKAKEVFGQIKAIRQHEPHEEGWPKNANAMFSLAARYLRDKDKAPFLWLETDAIPLCGNWLDQIETEYRVCTKHFLGTIYNIPQPHMNGVGVYPAQLYEINQSMFNADSVPFDLVRPDITLARIQDTKLIARSLANPKTNSPHTFPDNKSLLTIPAECVLFHGNKDGTLIRRLRGEAASIVIPEIPLTVVLPVCNKDAELMILNVEWMKELDGQLNYPAVLSFDESLIRGHRNKLIKLCRAAFRSLSQLVYPLPSTTQWPQAPNQAFQHTARYAKETIRTPWLWLEADAFPLKAGWLDVLTREYYRYKKPVMGPVVPGMGHVNGVAIYPSHFCDISPLAMRAKDAAWDALCRPDLHGKIHNAIHLIAHAWGENDDRFTEKGGMREPTFPDIEKLSWIPKGAVLFHRNKDGTLVKQLREQRERLKCELK